MEDLERIVDQGKSLLGVAGHLVAVLGNILDIGRDLGGCEGLLLGSGCNLGNLMVDFLDAVADVLEDIAELGYLIREGCHISHADVHGVVRYTHIGLNVLDGRGDFGSGCRGALGKGSYLVGNNRESASGIACSCSLDGRLACSARF